MNENAFLSILRRGLGDLPRDDVDEIMSDYAAHFAESRSRGRSEAEVVSALGDPARIARELRADLGLKRLEARWSPSNFITATSALLGLAIVDLFFLLPLLIVAFVMTAAIAAGLIAIAAGGLKIMSTAIFLISSETVTAPLGRLCIGAGFVSAGVGGGALLLMVSGGAIRLLGNYARLHFRLVQPDQQLN